MGRTTKYRLFDRKNNILWREGDSFASNLGDYTVEIFLDGSFSVSEFKCDPDGLKCHWYPRDSEDFELEQYVGISGAKGEDIFESDICLFGSIRGYIAFQKASYKFIFDNGDLECHLQDGFFEVIGHLHKDHELLEGIL